MHALIGTPVRAELFIRKLGGGSQSVLLECSDGILYVVKFTNNIQGPHVPFNESMGTELFKACFLPVPTWKPILLTRDFVNRSPNSWMDTVVGKLRPMPGLCFGSQFLGGPNKRLLEFLPGSYFGRVQNRSSFWLAWLLDVCCQHLDNRQVVFVEDAPKRLWPRFIDMGHMFKGPTGEQNPVHMIQSRYRDQRVYERIGRAQVTRILAIIRSLDADALWRVVATLPEDWISRSALLAFSGALNVLAKTDQVQEHLRLLLKSHTPTKEFHIPHIKGAQESALIGQVSGYPSFA